MSSIMYCSAEKNEDLIISQRENSTMYHFTKESKDLIMKQKMNTAVNCFIKEQNNLNEVINVIFKIMKIHKFSDSILIFNNIMISNLVDYTNYSFKNLT